MNSTRFDIWAPLLLLALLFGCLASPLIFPVPPPVGGSILDANYPLFSSGHVLGTDNNGNDVWSRLLHGGRTSLIIAFSVNLIGFVVGGLLGSVSAYLGGTADTVIMRILDALIAFPSLILVLAVAQALGPGETNSIWALSFFSVPAFSRLARAATLRLRAQPFLTAADLSGTATWRVLLYHIAPNIIPQLTTFALLGMSTVVNIEGAASFLGLGVRLPQPSWGNMIHQGMSNLTTTPTLVLLPSLFLFITALSFNLLSEALRTRWTQR
jgi:peptide/nickel transport system permease protein